MVCTYCNAETQVVNSRRQNRSNNVWRRRRCLACRQIFTTIEQVDYEKSWVVQYPDGSALPFLRDRLSISLYKALQHRSGAMTDAVGLSMTVMSKLRQPLLNGNITATAIATIAHDALRRFDKAAATMYAAYHADVL